MYVTQTQSWGNLEKFAQDFSIQTNKTKLQNAVNFPQQYHVLFKGISLDFSHQYIDNNVLNQLYNLANECDLSANIDALFSGELVNSTERKPALHTALRADESDRIYVNEENIIEKILSARQSMFEISEKIRQGLWLGYSGKPITDIVNIGIGGSQLGPKFCLQALYPYRTKKLNFHFISDIDPVEFDSVTANLDPATTLFIISSKSLKTVETLTNFERSSLWINHPNMFEKHFIAITANIQQAHELGFMTVLPLWDWIGGRFSICSAINLITCIAIGYTNFLGFLRGAQAMDIHFRHSQYCHNLPVLLALLGIWNNNFLNIRNVLILTYAKNLEHFTPYLQQLDMESNGKSLNKQGQPIDYATGPIIWGGSGCQARHSYFQLLRDGSHAVAADLITVQYLNHHAINHMCYAQRDILIGAGDAISKGMPLNLIRLNHCTPETIGALISLYEHKVYAQSVIWNINAFDQPAVEQLKSHLLV